MIQRKQSLFLLAVALVALLLFFIPFISFTRANEDFSLGLIEAISSISVTSHIYYPFILNVLVLILSFVTIFLFKNRVLQYKLANGLVLLNIFIMGLFFLLSFLNIPVDKSAFSFGAFLPVIGAAFAFLAAHFIKKDEQLVRSADRIR
jgi:uncharacterized membrane protein